VIPATHSSVWTADNRRIEVLETWRDTAYVVGARWRAYLEAGPGGRTWAFAAYVAALDAEEAAAAELAVLSSRVDA
jgi:hypothetical protein